MNEVAKTILAQLGGNRFIVMTGAKNFVYDKSSLHFSVGKTKNKANKIVVKLDPDDTYTMTFYKLRGIDLTKISEHSGLYFDQLQSVFTRETGLYTRL